MGQKIILWFGDFPDQVALAHKMAKEFNVCGVVFERRNPPSRKKMSFRTFCDKVWGKIVGRRLDLAWLRMFEYYRKKYPGYPDVPTLFVENINDPEVIDFTRDYSPQLALVSGTRMIRKRLIAEKPELGIFNLHTGLSPYIKGGPNCTNWCLATSQFHLIGHTIMWLDAGIDTGNIITTKHVVFNSLTTIDALHLEVVEQAHQLYIDAVKVAMTRPQVLPNIPQKEIAEGTTYYNRQWTSIKKSKALKGFRAFKTCFDSPALKKEKDAVTTISLPD